MQKEKKRVKNERKELMQSIPTEQTEEEKSSRTVCRRPDLQNKERLVRTLIYL
jgi:hypothetical protein